jgi:hypothetical protein
MQESVEEEFTVRIIYKGRATNLLLDNNKLQEI